VSDELNNNIKFNYDVDTPDLEAARSVAASIQDVALKPLTDLEIAERQEWLAEHRARCEAERIAADEYRLAQEREREAVAQREAAIAAQQARDKASVERQHQIDREVNRRGLMDLRLAAAKQDAFQRNVESADRNALAYQQRQTILSELEAMINPPQPTEPTVVHVTDDNDDDTFCGVKITRPNPRRSWW
jgi:hypothetical protein